ncbi:MAG: right-handed parallel beta-helix repeat-containing protein [Nanoarchaeota archaeon]
MPELSNLKRGIISGRLARRPRAFQYYLLAVLGVIFVVGMFLGALFFSVLFPPRLVGKVSFDIPAAYEQGSTLAGVMTIGLKEGELLPRTTVVGAHVNGQKVSLPLESLIADSLFVEGDYFIQGLRLAGEGQGYGLAGSRQRFPEVYFELRFLAKSDNDGSSSSESVTVVGEDFVGSSGEQDVGASSDEPSESDLSPSLESGSQSSAVAVASAPGVTAAVIREATIRGIARLDNSFVYDLAGYDDVNLVPGSVSIDGKIVDDDAVQLTRKNNKVIVSTTYYDEETGFGPDYVGANNLELVLNLSVFGFTLNQSDTLFVTLYHEGVLLAEAQKDITVEASVTGVDISVEKVHKRIVLGEPVQWKQRVDLSEPSKVTFELPEGATDITLTEILPAGDQEAATDNAKISEVIVSITDESPDVTFVTEQTSISEIVDIVEEVTPEGDEVVRGDASVVLPITGAAINLRETFAFLLDLSLTGYAIEEAPIVISSDASVSSIEVNYYTDAPYALESEIEGGKEITIVGPENILYENVLAFTDIPRTMEVREPSHVAIYWENNMVYLEPEEVLDTDANGLYDYVSWNVPHLSNQTFTIIVITAAQHLDSNRTFISDIYASVNALDGNWSETISDGHYVRVTFEHNLTSERDITIYPRIVDGDPSIDIYQREGNETIARFSDLNPNEYNKVYLSGLVGEEDIFDLHVLGGSIDIDHIIDPEDSNVASCRLLNETGLSYTQTANIIPNVTGSCINITASGVTFDGAGFWIANSTSAFAGISASNVSATIKNCNVTVATSTGGNGIELWYSNYSQIVNCTLNSQRIGVFLRGSSHVLLENDTINSNTVNGILVGSATTGSIWNVTIRSNNIFSSGVEGIGVDVAGSGHVFAYNTINNSVSKGINYDSVAATLIQGNVFGENPTGIDGSPSSDYIISNNTFYYSTTTAITAALTSNLTVDNNTFYHNRDAITFSEVSSSFVRDNMIHNSTRRGISISASTSSPDGYILGGVINGTGSEAIRISGAKATNLTFANITIVNSTILDLLIATASLNGTNLENISIGAYNFTGLGSLVTFRYYDKGDISFTNYINGSGLNLSAEVYIDNNFLFVNSSNGYLNQSANVTFYTVRVGPLAQLLRDGAVCSVEGASCINTSTLNITTITFNISKGGNYTIDMTSCLGSGCAEGGNCSIVSSCTLHNGLCTDSVCHFQNMTVNGTLYAGHLGGAGLARNLTLNVSERFSFIHGGRMDFTGLNTSTGNGGNAGILNITAFLFNRTYSNFSGYGGYAVQVGATGGNGGILQFNYHALFGGVYGSPSTPNVSGGGSASSLSGTYGSVTRVKDSLCPKDVDVNNNGLINLQDIILVTDRYNNISTDSGFNNATDIQCDNKINVIDISKLGFEYGTRPS